MPSTYSTNLALELIGTGDQAGVWGNTTNTNLGTLIEQAISGYVTQAVATGTDTTITIPNGATGVARNMYIELTGTGGTNTNLIVPSNKKLYFIFNNSTGAVTVKVSGQTGVSVPQGKKVVLVSNGTDIVNGINYIADFGTNSFTVTNLTATSATITTLTGTSAGITTISSGSANITQLQSTSATITTLTGTSANIATLSGTTATFTSATVTNLALTSVTLSNLNIASANITTLTSSSATISTTLALSGGTANGVLYLNGSKVATSGSALVFDGSKLGINRTPSAGYALDVDTSNGSYQRITGSDQGNVRLRFDNGGTGGRIWELVGGLSGANNADFSIRDVTGGTSPLVITSTSLYTASGINVGIGTSSPSYRFQAVRSGDGITAGISGGTYGIRFDNGGTFSSGASTIHGVDSTLTGSYQQLNINGSVLTFQTSATESARITSDGYFKAQANAAYISSSGLYHEFVGDSANAYIFRIVNDGNNANRYGMSIQCGADNAAGTNYALVFDDGDGTRQGEITFSGGTTTYGTSSDYRLKENIQPIENALDRLAQLKPVKWNWKRNGLESEGFVAHELQEVVPIAVAGEKDAVNENGDPVYQSVGAANVVPLLTKALQEAMTRIEQLEAKFAALESK